MAAKCSHRALSTASQKYPSKVRAIPFAVSADEVTSRWSLPLSIRCGGRGLLGSIAATILPFAGFSHLQPKYIQAAYLPVWMIDAYFEADMWRTFDEGKTRSKCGCGAFFYQSYMPGFVYEPLSNISLAHPVYGQFNNVRWSEELETQHGSEVLCLPFTHTPFKLADLVRSLSYEDATLSEEHGLRIEPPSVQDHMLAAYPLLLPVYIAQYEVVLLRAQEEPYTYTVVFEAHSRKGRIFIENVDKQIATNSLIKIRAMSGEKAPPSLLSMLTEMLPDDPIVSFGPHSEDQYEFAREIEVGSLDIENMTTVTYARPKKDNPLIIADGETHRGMRELQDALHRWVNAGAGRGALEQYRARYFGGEAEAAPVNWEDPRIREHTKEETARTRLWMRTHKLYNYLSSVMRNITVEGSKIEVLFVGTSADGSPLTVKDIEAYSAEGNRRHEENTPAWLKEWQLKQTGNDGESKKSKLADKEKH